MSDIIEINPYQIIPHHINQPTHPFDHVNLAFWRPGLSPGPEHNVKLNIMSIYYVINLA